MRNKITLFLVLITSLVNAQLWTIESCSNLGSNLYGPMYSTATANSASRSINIYPASQLIGVANQELTSMYFLRNTATGTMSGTPNFKIYLKEVSFADWGSSAVDWTNAINGATLVYDSNPASTVGSSNGWKQFVFSNNFLYSGSQNLAVFFEYVNNTASTNITWNYEYTGPCSNTSNNNTGKYTNVTTGILPTSLGTSNFRRPIIGFDFTVSCPSPVNLSSNSLSTNGINFQWSAGGTETSWEYSILPQGSGVPTSNIQTTNNNSLSITGLNPNTSYSFYLRSFCGTGDESIWIGPFNFKTLCEFATDFVENFDNYPTGTTSLPDCWSRAGTTTNVYITTGGVAPGTPPNRFYMSSTTTTVGYAILPPVSNLQANTHRLRLKAYCTTASKQLFVGYLTNLSDTNSFVLIQALNLPSTTAATATEFTIIPTNIPSGVNNLVFKNENTTSTTTLYIDDVKWELNSSCPEPTSINAFNPTNNSFNVSWVSSQSSFEIQYGIAGFALGTGTIVNNLTTNNFQITGLLPNTNYQVYVRANCGSEFSPWSFPVTIRTQCNPVSSFSENFDSYPTGANSLPDCWSRTGSSTTVSITASSVTPMSAPNRLQLSASGTTPTDAYAILPPVNNLQAESHRLKFKAYATSAGRFLDVGYFTNSADVNSFVLLESFPMPSTTAAVAEDFLHIPPALPAGIQNLVLRNKPGATGVALIYVDDVIWEAIPACLDPDFLSATNITSTSADLSWLSNGSEVEWQIEYGLTGFAQGSGTIITSIFDNPYTLTGLQGNTTYQYYVRAVCGSNDYSPWEGPLAFTTACGSYTEYDDNFEAYATGTGLLPACWLSAGNGTVNLTTGSVAPMSPTKRMYMFASSTTPTVAYAIFPHFSNLNSNSHRLRFKAYATTANRTLDLGYFSVPNDPSSFVLVEAIPMPSTVAASAQEFVIYPGVIPAGVERLVFRNMPTTTTAAIYFDDVKWEPIPNCIEPTNINWTAKTDASVTIQWTSNNTETEWEIEYGLDGFTLGTGTVVNATTNPFTINGLNPNTNYTFYVKAICSTTELSANSFPLNVRTDCGSVSTYNDNFEAYPTGTSAAPVDCWDYFGNGSVYLTTGSVAPMSPTKRMYMFSSTTANPPTVSYAALPKFNNLQANTHRLKVIAYATTANRFLDVGYFAIENDPSSFVLVEAVPLPSTAAASAQELIIYPGALPAGIERLVFRNAPTTTTAAIYFDDVRWELAPTCIEPNTVQVNAVNNNAAEISWTALNNETEWQIEYGPAGFTLGNGTIVNSTTNPYTITGLNPFTNYQVYVKAICSSTESSVYSNALTFRTECDPIANYNDNLEAYATGTNMMPDCWRSAGNGTVNLTTGSVAPMSPTKRMYMFASSTTPTVAYSMLPFFSNLQANTHRLKLIAYATTAGRTLDVGYFTNPSDLNSFVLIQALNLPSTAAASAIEFSVTPGALPAGVNRLVLRNMPTVTTAAIYFDDVIWEPLPTTAPTCTTGMASNLDPTCGLSPVVLSWNSLNEATAYLVRIGTTPGGNEIADNISVVNTNYSFTSPTPNTTYYWSVTPTNNVGSATNCSELSFTTPNGSCLCTPVYTTGKTLNDLISNVVISGTTLANNSGMDPVNPFYTYFAGQPNFTATLQSGTSYTIQVSNGTAGTGNVAVWIDYNNNELFEESEKVTFTTTTMDGSSTVSLNFTVPCLPQSGVHRMRVRYVWGSANPGSTMDPCASYSWGEVEDYDVTIQATPAVVGDNIQNITVPLAGDATLAQIVINPTNAKWYASESDALAAINELPLSTVLVSGTTYYAVNVVNNCASQPFAVTVTVTLGINNNNLSLVKIYPNPTSDYLTIQHSVSIQKIELYNLLGQLVKEVKVSSNIEQISLNQLSKGTYLLKVFDDVSSQSFKVIKQ
ncbi:MAG: fibronectin type III domain-containing protein [Flavobacteriales bacterium]|nr:fibronectin type III domain-containing protein [Flavobacteriales bacterium]